jgi:hypothetical protein
MRYPKRSQYKYAKSRYRVHNWADYEAALQKRGSLTVWLSKAALDAWRAPATGRPGWSTDLLGPGHRGCPDDPHGLLPPPPSDRGVPPVAG